MISPILAEQFFSFSRKLENGESVTHGKSVYFKIKIKNTIFGPTIGKICPIFLHHIY